MMMMMTNYVNDADNLNNNFNTDNLDHREGNCSIHEHNSLILFLPTYLPTYLYVPSPLFHRPPAW